MIGVAMGYWGLVDLHAGGLVLSVSRSAPRTPVISLDVDRSGAARRRA